MICVSLAEQSLSACLEALEALDFAEIRMDAMPDLAIGDVRLIFSRSARLIATYRPGAAPDEHRKTMLMTAIESGAAYVDVEIESEPGHREAIAALARSRGCKVIVSFHNHRKTPQKQELEAIVNSCFEAGADIAKVACMVHSDRDNARLLGLLDYGGSRRPLHWRSHVEPPPQMLASLAFRSRAGSGGGHGSKGNHNKDNSPVTGKPFHLCIPVKGKGDGIRADRQRDASKPFGGTNAQMKSIYAVAGNPIFQSRSPIMFNAALRELSLEAAYVRLAAATAEEVAITARTMGLGGINITTPFKTDIISHLDETDREARIIGAVNVVVNRDGRLRGLNTDIAGVLGALDQGAFDPEGKSAVVLGAGGAARAAAFALVSAGAHVVMANRTESKARQAAETLGCHHVPLGGIGKALKKADILISAISSYDPIIDPRFLHKGLMILDANYSKPTPLVEDATRLGLAVIHGREWLLAQAVPTFELFTGHGAPVPVMNHVLRKTKKDSRTNIALIGFMGSGKSTVAEALGRKTGMDIIDIDRNIEEKAGTSIAEIFSTSGEETFRRMEIDEIDTLRLVSNTVVSCGGGAVLRRPNVRVLRNNCLTVWLWSDIETALARIGDDGSRPLLNGLDPARASALLQERLFLYASACDLLVNTMGKQPDEIAQRIYDETYNTINR